MTETAAGSVWAMGGYAWYVWGSFGFALVVFAWNALAPRWRRKQLMDMSDD